MRPTAAEYNPYFERYISLVTGDRVVPVLADQAVALHKLLRGLPDDRAAFRYAPGKWSVRESLGHLIDTERVFGLRALWIARGDRQPLPGFEQDDFARAAHHDHCSIAQLVDEFSALRESHVLMFNHLPAEAWSHVGNASGNPLSTRAAAFIMAGHVIYHTAIFHQRYGL